MKGQPLTKEERTQRLKTVTDKLEAGIKDLYQSDRYAAYLRAMSKFHRYSFGNTLLILLQCPHASQVAGYQDWKKKFGRHVKAGETGITILAPCTFRTREEVEEVGADGRTVKTEQWVERRTYRTVTVFDISQTEGRELPGITCELNDSVEQYEAVLAALRETSPVPITFEPLPAGVHGCYNNAEKRIVIQPGMGQTQTLKTTIHEIAHSKLHDRPVGVGELTDAPAKDRHTREVEAESVAYVVCQHFGIDTAEYSFGYVAGWSKGRDLAELKASLDCIRGAAAEIIDGIESRCPELAPPEPERAEAKTPAKTRRHKKRQTVR